MNFEGEYDLEKMVIFLIKTDIGLDAIPFQFLSTPTIPDYG